MFTVVGIIGCPLSTPFIYVWSSFYLKGSWASVVPAFILWRSKDAFEFVVALVISRELVFIRRLVEWVMMSAKRFVTATSKF